MERDVKASLSELETILEEETVALRKLDRDAIDRIAAKKLALCDVLSAGPRGGDVPDPAQVARIRRLALHNQILLVHARDSVRGVLSILTGDANGPSNGDGHRLSVRV
jgi:flagellar biosynthesis/type III secretory pathway chaperone